MKSHDWEILWVISFSWYWIRFCFLGVLCLIKFTQCTSDSTTPPYSNCYHVMIQFSYHINLRKFGLLNVLASKRLRNIDTIWLIREGGGITFVALGFSPLDSVQKVFFWGGEFDKEKQIKLQLFFFTFAPPSAVLYLNLQHFTLHSVLFFTSKLFPAIPQNYLQKQQFNSISTLWNGQCECALSFIINQKDTEHKITLISLNQHTA